MLTAADRRFRLSKGSWAKPMRHGLVAYVGGAALSQKHREWGAPVDDKNDRQMESLFAAGRAAAARGWLDAVLVTCPEVPEIAPIGPPVVLVVDGAELSVLEAKALASAAGAGRPILVTNFGPPISPEAMAWIGSRVDIENFGAPLQEEEPTAPARATVPSERASDRNESGSARHVPSDADLPTVLESQRATTDTPALQRDGGSREHTPPPEKPRQRRWLMLAVAGVVTVGVASVGFWQLFASRPAPSSPAASLPSGSPPQSEDGREFDTKDAERVSVAYLADNFSTTKSNVTVRCPRSVPVSQGEFSCRFRVRRTGSDVTGKVTYTLTKDSGDTVTLRPNYKYD